MSALNYRETGATRHTPLPPGSRSSAVPSPDRAGPGRLRSGRCGRHHLADAPAVRGSGGGADTTRRDGHNPHSLARSGATALPGPVRGGLDGVREEPDRLRVRYPCGPSGVRRGGLPRRTGSGRNGLVQRHRLQPTGLLVQPARGAAGSRIPAGLRPAPREHPATDERARIRGPVFTGLRDVRSGSRRICGTKRTGCGSDAGSLGRMICRCGTA